MTDNFLTLNRKVWTSMAAMQKGSFLTRHRDMIIFALDFMCFIVKMFDWKCTKMSVSGKVVTFYFKERLLQAKG